MVLQCFLLLDIILFFHTNPHHQQSERRKRLVCGRVDTWIKFETAYKLHIFICIYTLASPWRCLMVREGESNGEREGVCDLCVLICLVKGLMRGREEQVQDIVLVLLFLFLFLFLLLLLILFVLFVLFLFLLFVVLPSVRRLTPAVSISSCPLTLPLSHQPPVCMFFLNAIFHIPPPCPSYSPPTCIVRKKKKIK